MLIEKKTIICLIVSAGTHGFGCKKCNKAL